MKRTASRTGLMLFLALAGIPVRAQNQTASNSQSASSGQSLGEYARQVRKAPDSSSKPRVFDNDNLPRTDKLSIVGAPPAPAGSATNAEATESATPGAGEGNQANASKPANTPEDKAAREAAIKQWSDKLDSQQQQIDLLSRELDVTQREYQLRAAAMYADAGNRLRNSADWDKQDAQYKQQIADKQKALDDAKQKMDDLKDQAHKAGMPESVQQPAQAQ
jgi:predicted RNase H-like nuclease (RuvC/YqgF family)